MSRVFDAYAAYYDLFYRDKPYADEAEYVDGLITEHKPSARHILELGSGTGAHAEHLARKGFDVIGIDSSRQMLEWADKRRADLPDNIGSRLHFYRGDLRSFRASSNLATNHFDVVLSLFHVFSYQNTNADLQGAFATAAAHLRPGGVLIFDFWYGPAVLTQQPEVRVKRMSSDTADILRIAEPEIEYDKNCVQVRYTVLVTNRETCQVQNLREDHPMRYLFFPEIELLSSPYFRTIARYEWMKRTAPGPDSWTAVCVMERLP